MLLPGRQESQNFALLCLCVVMVSKGLFLFFLSFNDFFLVAPVTCPPSPLYPMQSPQAALVLLFRDEIELQVSCRDPRTKSVFPFMRFSESAVLTSSEISNMCFLLYDKEEV